MTSAATRREGSASLVPTPVDGPVGGSLNAYCRGNIRTASVFSPAIDGGIALIRREVAKRVKRRRLKT